jgi:hypothetical protein
MTSSIIDPCQVKDCKNTAIDEPVKMWIKDNPTKLLIWIQFYICESHAKELINGRELKNKYG